MFHNFFCRRQNRRGYDGPMISLQIILKKDEKHIEGKSRCSEAVNVSLLLRQNSENPT